MSTWLSPYASVWHQQYPHAALPFKQLARYLKPLTEIHSPEQIATELAVYLRQTPAQYVNLAKFAACFGAWSPPPIAPPEAKPVPVTRAVVEYRTPGGRLRYRETP